jgi:hypothetical protein
VQPTTSSPYLEGAALCAEEHKERVNEVIYTSINYGYISPLFQMKRELGLQALN